MCGIVGAINHHNIVPDLIQGLSNIEYRGYDSAGISVVNNKGLITIKRPGKLKQLRQHLNTHTLNSHAGIGHTRWATHGKPNETNAHPHSNQDVSVVHNGIIENYLLLREWLSSEGYTFRSDTDTEVIPHLISYFLAKGELPHEALNNALKHLEGAFALGVLFRDDPDHLYAARRGSPLVIGQSDQGLCLGSDTMALPDCVRSILFLREGELACLSADDFKLLDKEGHEIQREMQVHINDKVTERKENHQFYMHKEIHQQPTTVKETLRHTRHSFHLLPFDFKELKRINIVACGTSYYAAMISKYWFEQIAKIPVDIDIASEFRYREPVLSEGGLSVFISQSGETADTLAALKHAKEQGQQTFSIINVAASTIARESDFSIQTQAGPEIGVASTKAFTAQLTILAALALHASKCRQNQAVESCKQLQQDLSSLPDLIQETLKLENQFKAIGGSIKGNSNAFYIGRGTHYPLALEGALKLKEISYLHAEGFGAGELKHGPIALIEPGVPVFVLAPKDHLIEKTLSNTEEVIARGGRCIVLGDHNSLISLPDDIETLILPDFDSPFTPIVYAIALQLIAYHAALAIGTDVDQPRNLAKSVTVE